MAYFSSGAPTSWFFRILHNVSVDYLRQRRIKTTSLDTLLTGGYAGPADHHPSSSPETDAERRALAAALAKAFGRLRVPFREAIILKYQQGLSIDEIAEVLSIPQGTVKTYLHRGRKELAVILSAAGWGRAES